MFYIVTVERNSSAVGFLLVLHTLTTSQQRFKRCSLAFPLHNRPPSSKATDVWESTSQQSPRAPSNSKQLCFASYIVHDQTSNHDLHATSKQLSRQDNLTQLPSIECLVFSSYPHQFLHIFSAQNYVTTIVVFVKKLIPHFWWISLW